MTTLPNPFMGAPLATATKTLNTKSFPDRVDAIHALFMEGFEPVDGVADLYRSADGIIDATIKRRFRDGRFYIVLFA